MRMPWLDDDSGHIMLWLLALVVLCRGVYVQAQALGNEVYYRMLVDSFKDGDGNGLGDLKGATKQLSYLRAIAVDGIILSPINMRSSDCSTPGSMDFTEIDPRYGDLDAFTGLLDKAKKLELKVLVTLPVRTVSLASEWFTHSSGRVTGYEDRIAWKEGTPDDPPQSDATTTWTYNEQRGAYYASIDNEPVLNLCSETTVAALSAAICAWARRGLNGMLINKDYQLDQQCGERMINNMAAEAARCARAAGFDATLILAESTVPPREASKFIETGIAASSVISNALTSPERKTAAELILDIHAAILFASSDDLPVWITSSSSSSRVASRHGSELVDAINLLTLTLPGTAVVQQGDDLGAVDAILEWADSNATCWPGPMTKSSAPFSWDATTNAGFTSGEPWMPLSPNYRYANAKTEFANELSHMGVLRVAAALRKTPVMGAHYEIKRLNEAIAVLRWGNAGSLLVVANVAMVQTEALLSKIPGIPAEMTVATSSAGSQFSPGTHVAIDKGLKLSPGEAVLMVGPPRHCGGPGPVDKITSKLQEGWQKLNKYFNNR